MFVRPFLLLDGEIEVRASPLDRADFAVLARSLDAVRPRHRFLLAAWVFLPDHGHAILFPPYPLTISGVMKSIKLTSTMAVGRCRREPGELWQGRFFDYALRTVRRRCGLTVDRVRLPADPKLERLQTRRRGLRH